MQVLFDHNIVNIINRILLTVVFKQCSLADVSFYDMKCTLRICFQVLELKHSAVELLEVMCEETHPETEKLVQNVFENIDLDALQDALVYFYKLSKDSSLVRN